MLLVGRELDYVEFMAVRKIPMKGQSRFAAGHESTTSQKGDTDVDTEDPDVSTVLARMREKVLADRSLHDKVHTSRLPYLVINR